MIKPLINLLKTSKTQLGISLTIIFITAFLNNPSPKTLLVFLLSLMSTAISDLLFVRLRNIKLSFPSAAFVTGSIIGLLTSPDLGWYVPIVISIIAMFSKNFIRLSNRHIFNPAGFGLLVGSLLFHNNVSWWAVSWQRISLNHIFLIVSFLILLTPTLISILRMKRYRITLSFLITYLLANKIFNFQLSIFNSIFDPTILFFSIVMLPEPMTTPNNHKRQIIFGIFVALVSIFSSYPISNFIPTKSGQISNLSLDPLIFSLLLGNLVFLKFR